MANPIEDAANNVFITSARIIDTLSYRVSPANSLIISPFLPPPMLTAHSQQLKKDIEVFNQTVKDYRSNIALIKNSLNVIKKKAEARKRENEQQQQKQQQQQQDLSRKASVIKENNDDDLMNFDFEKSAVDDAGTDDFLMGLNLDGFDLSGTNNDIEMSDPLITNNSKHQTNNQDKNSEKNSLQQSMTEPVQLKAQTEQQSQQSQSANAAAQSNAAINIDFDNLDNIDLEANLDDLDFDLLDMPDNGNNNTSAGKGNETGSGIMPENPDIDELYGLIDLN